ncbi:hypothetical protein WJX81_008211 [Elliptochloris bilobata]|uniref:Uncharacterized protein n=1 Tax=Elliptochloris bilobata TaxID=381761 RepID=A0AAW1RTJ8_9CHLO
MGIYGVARELWQHVFELLAGQAPSSYLVEKRLWITLVGCLPRVSRTIKATLQHGSPLCWRRLPSQLTRRMLNSPVDHRVSDKTYMLTWLWKGGDAVRELSVQHHVHHHWCSSHDFVQQLTWVLHNLPALKSLEDLLITMDNHGPGWGAGAAAAAGVGADSLCAGAWSNRGLHAFPEVATHLTALTALNLAGSALTAVPRGLAKLSRLRSLHLGGPWGRQRHPLDMRALGPLQLCADTSLEVWLGARNYLHLRGTVRASCALATLPELRTLHLSWCCAGFVRIDRMAAPQMTAPAELRLDGAAINEVIAVIEHADAWEFPPPADDPMVSPEGWGMGAGPAKAARLAAVDGLTAVGEFKCCLPDTQNP